MRGLITVRFSRMSGLPHDQDGINRRFPLCTKLWRVRGARATFPRTVPPSQTRTRLYQPYAPLSAGHIMDRVPTPDEPVDSLRSVRGLSLPAGSPPYTDGYKGTRVERRPMKNEIPDHFPDELHAELPGIGSLLHESESAGADEQGIAGFAFDSDGTPLPCALSVISPGPPFALRIHGDIDIHSFSFLVERMGRVIALLAERDNAQEAGRDVLIELIHCTYLDSRGMGLLIKTARDVQAVGGRMSLSHVSPKVHKVLTLTGMDKIFTVIP